MKGPWWGPNRDPNARDYVPVELYRPNSWTDYLNGPAYFLSPAAVSMIFEYVRCLPALLTVMDVEIAGLLLVKLKIPMIDLTQYYYPGWGIDDMLAAARTGMNIMKFKEISIVHSVPPISEESFLLLWNFYIKNNFFLDV